MIAINCIIAAWFLWSAKIKWKYTDPLNDEPHPVILMFAQIGYTTGLMMIGWEMVGMVRNYYGS